jgi:hypothetical protein
MLLVIFGWVLFRATTISGALSYLKTMLFLNGAQLLDGNTIVYLAENRLSLILGILFSMPVYKLILNWLEEKMRNGSPALTGAVMIVYPAAMLFLFFVSMSYIVKGSYNPFIYFNF